MRYAVLAGNMAEGFNIVGPFNSEGEAMRASLNVEADCYVLPITSDTKLEVDEPLYDRKMGWVLHGEMFTRPTLQGPFVKFHEAQETATSYSTYAIALLQRKWA